MPLGSEHASFPTTSWTLIHRIKSDDPTTSIAALEEILSRYRYPLYCYLRRRALDHHDAEDVLHDFIASFLRGNSFSKADETKGRLRSYLAASLSRRLAGWHTQQSKLPQHYNTTQDNGGSALEALYAQEHISENETPDLLFERKWALALLRSVIDRLQITYTERGKDALFATLRPTLLAGGSLRGYDSATLAANLGLSPEALRNAHHRLLSLFRTYLREEVAQTVESPEAIDAEIDHLRRLFAAG